MNKDNHRVIESQISKPTALPVVVNPLDLPTKSFSAGLKRRGENRAALMNWIREALVDGTDYGTICFKNGTESKPSLRKPGAEKICGMLGLSVQFPNLQQYEEAAIAGHEIKQIILRCELRDGQERLIASGIGARSLMQDSGDLNKSLKMAAKSAQIDATLRCAGLSEVFTQDLEDMSNLKREPLINQHQLAQLTERLTQLDNETQQKVYNWLVSIGCSTNLAKMTIKCWEALNKKLDLTEQTRTQTSTISIPQKTRLEAMIGEVAKHRGMSAKELREQVKKQCKTQWGIEHFTELNAQQYQELCDVQLQYHHF